MRRLIRFYENVQPASEKQTYTWDDRVRYSWDDIVNHWSDYRFQVRQKYIQWLFPLETDKETPLSKGLKYKFRTNQELRRKVKEGVKRYLLFLGFRLNDDNTVVQEKPLYRDQYGIIVGLYNQTNYKDITRILVFLKEIQMQDLSKIFFNTIIKAVKETPDLKHIVSSANVLKSWIETQDYEDPYKQEELIIGRQLEDWEKDILPTVEEGQELDAWD
jgi:hypothetical protein